MRSSSDAITTRRCGWRARAIRQRGDFVGAHRVLTAAAAMAGEIDLAKAALQELRRVAAEHLARLDRAPVAAPR